MTNDLPQHAAVASQNLDDAVPSVDNAAPAVTATKMDPALQHGTLHSGSRHDQRRRAG
jgi:hypothetical protein